MKQSPAKFFFILFYGIIHAGIISCTAGDETASEQVSGPFIAFPDSTNLYNAADSLAFAELCISDHGRNDIADRYFRAIVSGWNHTDSCNEAVSESFGWLSSEESRKPLVDTSLMFAWLDSAILACPDLSSPYVIYGALLLEFNLPGGEPYFNLAIEKGADVYQVSQYIAEHPILIDTTKLNFNFLSREELHIAN